MCWGLFFKKVPGHQFLNFIKKETPTQIFSLNICNGAKLIYPKKQKERF